MADFNRLAFKDEFLTIIPVRSLSSNRNDECLSFIGIPAQAKPKFLPKIAKELGCDPRLHFRELSNFKTVTLPNGNVVRPEQVMDDLLPSQAFILVFLPSEDFVTSFINDNQELFQNFYDNRHSTFETSIIYHSVPMSCI